MLICRREDGRYTFIEEVLRFATPPGMEPAPEDAYWFPLKGGGLFGTMAEAEADARSTVAWLKAS